MESLDDGLAASSAVDKWNALRRYLDAPVWSRLLGTPECIVSPASECSPVSNESILSDDEKIERSAWSLEVVCASLAALEAISLTISGVVTETTTTSASHPSVTWTITTACRLVLSALHVIRGVALEPSFACKWLETACDIVELVLGRGLLHLFLDGGHSVDNEPLVSGMISVVRSLFRYFGYHICKHAVERGSVTLWLTQWLPQACIEKSELSDETHRLAAASVELVRRYVESLESLGDSDQNHVVLLPLINIASLVKHSKGTAVVSIGVVEAALTQLEATWSAKHCASPPPSTVVVPMLHNLPKQLGSMHNTVDDFLLEDGVRDFMQRNDVDGCHFISFHDTHALLTSYEQQREKQCRQLAASVEALQAHNVTLASKIAFVVARRHVCQSSIMAQSHITQSSPVPPLRFVAGDSTEREIAVCVQNAVHEPLAQHIDDVMLVDRPTNVIELLRAVWSRLQRHDANGTSFGCGNDEHATPLSAGVCVMPERAVHDTSMFNRSPDTARSSMTGRSWGAGSARRGSVQGGNHRLFTLTPSSREVSAALRGADPSELRFDDDADADDADVTANDIVTHQMHQQADHRALGAAAAASIQSASKKLPLSRSNHLPTGRRLAADDEARDAVSSSSAARVLHRDDSLAQQERDMETLYRDLNRFSYVTPQSLRHRRWVPGSTSSIAASTPSAVTRYLGFPSGATGAGGNHGPQRKLQLQERSPPSGDRAFARTDATRVAM